MKKFLIKAIVFLAVFLVSLFVGSRVMNQGHDNMTMEMAAATLPVMHIERDGIAYNELHGYVTEMAVAQMRDTITVLDESRAFAVVIDTYGRNVTGMSLELRSIDGNRLIENTPIADLRTGNKQILADVALKDLIEKDNEYSLRLTLTLDADQQVYYYTRVIWGDALHIEEKLAFVKDFHERLYDREAAKELTRYLETNAQLEDNSSFHQVNIHSSFKQITWGDLGVEEVDDSVIQLTEIGDQTASFLVHFLVSTESENGETYYRVVEHYRIRYTTDRIYLLNYERTMTQIPDVTRMYANDKILLGITGTDIPLAESEDGSTVVFEVDGALYSYNLVSNKLAVVFSFYDELNQDRRAMYDRHGIKILNVDEGGNISFAVYGYMNRGQHEGEVGIQVYTYSSAKNTIEENIYIPYNKEYALLKPQMEKLLYLNKEQVLYLILEDVIYSINLEEKTYYPLATITQMDTAQISDRNWTVVWQDGEDVYHSHRLNIRNLNTGMQQEIRVEGGEAVKPLGFMEEDIIYGVAREEDIYQESSGRILFPMYKVCICDSQGNLLKEYSQEDIYVTDCQIDSNQITLSRVRKQTNGSYAETTPDQIMNSIETQTGKYVIVAPSIDTYERYVQIQTKHTIDSKTIQILTPKEVVFEGGRELVLDSESDVDRFYVYGAYGVEGIYSSPSKAVTLANEMSGVVVDQNGNRVWRKGNRVTRNQIMAITEKQVTEEKGSLAVCLDTVLEYEGVLRNTESLLEQGQTIQRILQENLDHVRVLDLAGCELDAMLYYVNADLPVLALLSDGEAVLITGYNELNVVVMDPKKGMLAKMGMNDATEWLKKNGNNFVTYIRTD
ncbi:MAG: hypothetical protein IJ794_14850 [Lachnospiraceae bacterium]|nr:hypothetical protein [Lachnospiraceae bacterium]